jgi:hypothetical protein
MDLPPGLQKSLSAGATIALRRMIPEFGQPTKGTFITLKHPALSTKTAADARAPGLR